MSAAGTVPAAEDLRAAAGAAGKLLAAVPDFAMPVPAMGVDVRSVVRHVAECLHWYAHDLVGGPIESPGPRPDWPADAAPADLIRELGIAAEVLARVVALAGPGDRGWHPWGQPDAAGMAAIGIDRDRAAHPRHRCRGGARVDAAGRRRHRDADPVVPRGAR
jgi:hypothetical protein